MRKLFVGALAASLAASLCGAAPAGADPFPQLPAATVLSNDELANVRGKFILPPGPHAAVAAALQAGPRLGAASPLTALPQTHAAASPLSGVTSAGPGASVAYFGIDMISSWTVGTGAAAKGVSVGAQISVNPNAHSVSVATWSSSQNGGLPSGPATGNTVAGAPPIVNASGVGQSIQVAGNGNTVDNEATISVGDSAPGQNAVPATNTCGSDCTASVDANGINIGISTAQGVVAQTIGANGVLQSVQITSDMNAITNQLGIHVGVAPTNALNPAGIGLILQTLNGIR